MCRISDRVRNRSTYATEELAFMDAAAFVDKWRKSRRSERSASQEHFLDLCEVLKHPKPGAVDPKGLSFTTERRVKKEG